MGISNIDIEKFLIEFEILKNQLAKSIELTNLFVPYVGSTKNTNLGLFNLTTTGTIQAEQLTSTDDITAAGVYSTILKADDISGLSIDGATTPYTGTGAPITATINRTINTAGSTAGMTSKGLNNLITINHALVGATGGAFVQDTRGDYNLVTVNSAHSGTAAAILVDSTNAKYGLINDTRTISSAGSPYINSFAMRGGLQGTFNYSGAGTLLYNYFGLRSDCTIALNETGAGTLNSNFYGSWVSLTPNASVGTGTSTGYGYYISEIQPDNLDAQWGFYNNSVNGHNFFGKDNVESSFGNGFDMVLKSDGTNGIIDVVTALRLGNKVTNYTEISATGDQVFVGSAGLPYGSFYGNEFNQSQAMTTNTEYQVAHASIADSSAAHNITSNGNGMFTITKAGRYNIQWAITAEHSLTGKHVLWGVAVDQALRGEGQMHRETKTANAEYQVAGNTIINMAVGEDIEIGFKSADGTPGTAVISHMNLSVVQIGG